MRTTLWPVLAATVLFALPTRAPAQYQAVGEDGIAASPKLRARLEEERRNHRPATVLATTKQMSCNQCKDTLVTVRDTESKGAGARALLAGGPPTKAVARHECKGCGTDWIIAGQGKARTNIALHRCTGCGEANLACCNTTKGAGMPAKDTGKQNAKDVKFELAPLR
jgi:hypothetical protein